MTRFGRFLRNIFERLLKRYYEGPTPPVRISQGVNAFAVFNRGATVADWMAFATSYAEECYRAGYQRGLEWAERDLDRRDPVADPELLEDKRRHGWSWVDLAPDENEVRRIVQRDPYAHLSPEQRLLALDSIGRQVGGYRVVMQPKVDAKRR